MSCRCIPTGPNRRVCDECTAAIEDLTAPGLDDRLADLAADRYERDLRGDQ